MKKERGSDPGNSLNQPSGPNPSQISYAWLAYLGLGILFIAAYYLLALPEAARILTLLLLEISPVGAFAIGLRVHRPARPGTWYLLLASLLAFATGDTLWEYKSQVAGSDPLTPASGVFYLAGYTLVFAALLLAARKRNPGGDRASLLDAAIVATGTGILYWTLLAAPYLRDSTLPTTQQFLVVIFPLVDILLLAALARLFLAPGSQVTAYWLLCLGLGAFLVSNTFYGAGWLAGTGGAGVASDVWWSLFYIFWGAAALHPSMRFLTEEAPRRRTGSSRKRLVLLAAASLLMPAILAVQVARGAPANVPVLVAGSALLFSLVLARMEGTLRILSDALEKRKKAEAESRASERRFRQLFDQSVDALIVFDTDGDIRDCNQESCDALGYSREEMLRLKVGDISGGEGLLSEAERREQQRETENTLWQRYIAGKQKTSTVHEGFHRRKDGTTYPVEAVIGGVEYGGEHLILASVRDVTERKRLETRLRYQASHDHLTNLPNRKLFEQHLERATDRARRNGLILGVLYLDLDNFKQINDSFGHETGDLLLVEVSRRLEKCLRPADTVARLGGDEFCILLEDLSSAGEATEISHRVARMLKLPVKVAGRKVYTAASIGVAVGIPGDREPVSLLREADAAMYRTKRTHKIHDGR